MNTLFVSTYTEQNIIRIMCGALLMCAALYGAFIFSVVFSTVDRQNYEYSMQKTNSVLGELESEYIAQAKTLDLSYARSNGFQDATAVKFTKKNSGLGVTVTSRNDI